MVRDMTDLPQELMGTAQTTVLTPEQDTDRVIGHVIEDRYKLVAVIGRGGFGTVYRAEHQRLPRDFAVKILHAARAVDARQVERFRQEVRAAAVVRHPYVVEVIDYGHDPAVGHFIVMPLLEGFSLLERLGREMVLPIVDFDTVLVQSAAALGAAHALGIVHCDIKSENVHLVRDLSAPAGFHVCILDFGVARARPLPGEAAQPDASRVVGTALSMSPEQVLRQDVDARADVYGLGVVLYEMLTGNLPFIADKSVEMMRMHVQDAVRRPSSHAKGSWIPPVLDQLVVSMLAKSREDRPQSMAEVVELWEAMRAQGYAGPVVFCTSVQSDAVRSQVAMQGDERFVTKGRELHTIPQVLVDLGLTPEG